MTQVEFGVFLLIVAAVIGLLMGAISGFFTVASRVLGDWCHDYVVPVLSSYRLWFAVFAGCIVTGLYLILS